MSNALVPISGYEGKYSVTKDGRVWSHPNHMHDGVWLKQCLRKGYPFVDLCKKNVCIMFSVHRIVANAFLENKENLPQVNHKNGIKTDNRVENLEWCTASQNKQHSWDIGTSVTTPAKRIASSRNAYTMLAKRAKGRFIREAA